MKALILAAGYGKRLRPITDSIPKSMVEVNGIPLLVNALNILASLKIDEIGIVVGHMAGYIKEKIGSSWQGVPVVFFDNPRYLETNNVASLACAASYCDDDMLLMECDLFYRKKMIENLLAGEGDCSILVSPYDPDVMDGTAIIAQGNKVNELVLGKWQTEDFDYSIAKKTVNMYRFNKEFAGKFLKLIDWYVKNMGENSYYEKVLGSMIYLRECDFRIVEVPASAWCEIDDVDDLERARKHFAD